MNISELVAILEQRKETYGDIRVATYDNKFHTVVELSDVVAYWDENDEPYLDIS